MARNPDCTAPDPSEPEEFSPRRSNRKVALRILESTSTTKKVPRQTLDFLLRSEYILREVEQLAIFGTPEQLEKCRHILIQLPGKSDADTKIDEKEQSGRRVGEPGSGQSAEKNLNSETQAPPAPLSSVPARAQPQNGPEFYRQLHIAPNASQSYSLMQNLGDKVMVNIQNLHQGMQVSMPYMSDERSAPREERRPQFPYQNPALPRNDHSYQGGYGYNQNVGRWRDAPQPSMGYGPVSRDMSPYLAGRRQEQRTRRGPYDR